MKNYDYKKLPPFKGMVLQNFPFIEEDFDAITNYQLLCKVVEYLNNINKNNNELIDNINALNNWFNNLDVQDEINNKLDQMVEDGTFDSILQEFLNLVRYYNTVEDMKTDIKLTKGLICKTLGFYEKDDLGGAYYVVEEYEEDISNNKNIIKLNNNYYAVYVPDINKNVKQFGAYGDGINDDTLSFELAGNGSYVPAGIYKINSNIEDSSINYKNYNGIGLIKYNDITWYVGRNEKGTLYINNDLEFDNGTGIVPRTPHDGMINIFNGQLKFWADMDGDGDYDADVYSKDNFYLACKSNIHLIRGQNDDLTQAENYGRIVIAGTTNTNFIQTGKNYSGSELKHLAFSNYRSTDYFMIFNHNTGFTGIGKYYSDPKARCHIASDENTVLILENKSGENVRLSFKTSSDDEDNYLNSTIGIEDGVMTFRTNNERKLRIDTDNYVLPGIASTTNLGSSEYPWANIYSVNSLTVTSDKRFKTDISNIDEKIFDAWENIEYKQYKIKNGDDKIHFGILAQDIVAEFEKVGLNALDYGLVVYDEENDIYNVRYDEVNIIENAYMRYKKRTL